MWNQFILQNIHFALNVFTSLSLFSIFWLYFDAWFERKTVREGIKIFGFLLLSFTFLMSAVHTNAVLSYILPGKILAYLLIAGSIMMEPIEKRPSSNSKVAAFLLMPALAWSSPILVLLVSLLYLRKATIGLENHLKKISFAFFAMTLYETSNFLTTIYSNTTNIDIYNWVRPYGPIWIVAHIFLAIFSIITIKWSFSYLLKRINTQLFIIFTTSIITIFIITAISFSFLLFKNMVDETLNRLSTDTSVLSFGIEAKKKEAMSTSLSVSKDPRIVNALLSNDRRALGDIAEEAITTYFVSGLTIVDSNSVIVARGEDRERTGDSLSEDPLVKRLLQGTMQSSIVVKQGTLAPIVLVRSGYPIQDNGKYIGAVLTSITLDSTFLDGIKKATGLEASIYGDNILSATTIGSSDMQNKPIGIKEANKLILSDVLGKGQPSSLETKVLDIDYLASYHPLLDINNTPVGLIFVGKPSYETLQAVDRSVRNTFLITIILVMLSVIPSHFISKYITKQLN